MLIVSNKQIDIFKKDALKNFEDEMVEHIKTYFPTHYNAIQEPNVRATIQFGYAKAKNYGLTTIRNVCLYLNNMLLLGSNFDEDKQYPWAKEILTDKRWQNPKIKIDNLSDKTLEQLGKVTGPSNIYVYRAMLNFTKKSNEIFKTLIASRLSDALSQLKLLFKQKYEVVGEENLNEMIKYGITNASRYGITQEPYVLVYIVFMFMLGSGYDKDPQFPWANEILSDKSLNQLQKTEILYSTAINKLEEIISRYSQKA